ncbi:DUF5677 domain-containing protein [Nitrospira sp. MA-1]|nr:DUF5677 domain-containing protein [Nitrospira sp. MA-1]
MQRIGIAEIPNFDNGTTKENGLRVQKMRSVMLNTVNSLLNQNDQASKASPMIVVTGVFHRMAECTLSIELLASKGFVRDAAILLVTLIELRLDLQYIALSPGRVDDWLKHKTKNQKPWKVKKQILEIFRNTNERDAEVENYCTFSMVKHGNPAGETATFPIGVREDALVLPNPDEKRNLLPIYLFTVAANLYQASVAAGKMVHPIGFDISSEIEQLNKLYAELKILNERHLLAIIKKYRQGPDNSNVKSTTENGS